MRLAAVVSVVILAACSPPTAPDTTDRTALGITVDGADLLADGWRDEIDIAWTAAQSCYGVTASPVSVEVINCERMCNGGRGPLCYPCGSSTGFCAGNAYRDRVKVCQDLAALEHEFRHITSDVWDRDTVPPCKEGA